jgi:hypothetical protein
MKMWGPYPALVFKPNNITHGLAYEVRTEEDVEKLKYYETDAYRVKGCLIKFGDDGREVPGKTFVWNKGKEELKEGTFSLRDWQMEQLEKQRGTENQIGIYPQAPTQCPIPKNKLYIYQAILLTPLKSSTFNTSTPSLTSTSQT